MKKSLFFAAAVAMFFSCSQDDNVSPTIMQEASEFVPIQLSVSSAVQQTRAIGSGAVGDVDATKNMWKGQQVNVFMFKKGTLELAKFNADDTNAIFEDMTFIANDPRATNEGSNAVVAQTIDNSIKYYPTQGNYDFWGYRLDGARTSEPALNGAGDEYVANFKIDGSQDVMVAKAVPTPADMEILTGLGDTEATRAYSAYAARHDVQPVLDFKHLLTRLKFFAIAGEQSATDAANGIKIDSIKVLSKTTGKLIVAYTGAARDQLSFDDGQELDSLSLMERASADVSAPLQKLTEGQQPTWNTGTDKSDTLQLGESIIVSPETQYKAKVFLHQEKSISSDPTVPKKHITYGYDLDLVTPAGTPFKAGYSYNVYLTLWGLQEISTSMSLQPWAEEDGNSNIDIRPEDLVTD